MKGSIKGTPYFPNKQAADDYYADYGLTSADVQGKIERGEIYLTRPPLQKGEKLVWLDEGRRYGVQKL